MTDLVSLDVRSAKRTDKPLLEDMMQHYLEGFASFETIQQDAIGKYVYPYLKHYWEDPNRYPFLFRVAGEPAGFALLRFEADPITGQGIMHLAEFFVAPRFRRTGIGTEAARRLWDLFPGRWSVRVLTSNKPAYPFWKQVISHYTAQGYNEQAPFEVVGGAITFTFMSATDTDLPDDIDPELFDF